MAYPEVYNYKGETADDGWKAFAVRSLSARIAAMISLIVAVAVFQTNDVKVEGGYVYTYHDFRSYKFGFWVALIGLGYTVLQVPFAIHYMLRKKHLINSKGFLKFDFYADKVVAVVLGMAAGVAWGATMELRTVDWNYDKEKMRDFISIEYIPASFMLIATIAAGISSIHSSLALLAQH